MTTADDEKLRAAIRASRVERSLDALDKLACQIADRMKQLNVRIRSGVKIPNGERWEITTLFSSLDGLLRNIATKDEGVKDFERDCKYVQEQIDDFTQRCIESEWFTKEQAEDRVKRGIHWYQPIAHNERKSVNVEIPTILLDDEDNSLALRDELWEAESNLDQTGELEDSTYEEPELIIDDI